MEKRGEKGKANGFVKRNRGGFRTCVERRGNGFAERETEEGSEHV